MKAIIRYITAALLAAAVWGCGQRHFLSEAGYREKVRADFLARRELAAGRAEALFSVMDRRGLSTEQREALEFLYAYMPLCDLSEYDGDYFLRQVDGAFRARRRFHWGKTVPEDIFRHFVLVHRVNNEYMDDARDVFFDELEDRVADLSMYDAALEVNHWCHEKVTYRGTDARTSAPLALALTSWGRCGEESTFTVAALRAVGIPARQCYTPRWVHTDDNHAWVEVWADGAWYYMGACEPQPELNAAWFDGPVQRAMMTHTTVYGAYGGPEEKNVETPLYSVINTLSNYAPTRRAGAKVVDEEGNAVSGARVRFKVYNYAELFALATLRSDDDGRASITTGLGDLMIRADSGGAYGYVKSGAEDAEVTVVLDRRPGAEYRESFVMDVPPERPFREIPQGKAAANAVRLAREDSLRNAYMATFATEEYARGVAGETDLDGDPVWKYIGQAQGNWREIEKFIRDNGRDALMLLAALREKDLRDTPAGYLESYLRAERPDFKIDSGSAKYKTENMFAEVISPRIGNELITPYANLRPDGEARGAEDIIRYVSESVRVSDLDNYYNCRQTPSGVHALKVADRASRDIYFVAMCRAAGIPARLEPATGKPQYRREGDYCWVDVDFEGSDAGGAVPVKGKLTLRNDPANIMTPGYESHFTIAVWRDGDFRTLDLGSHFAGNETDGCNAGGSGGAAFPVTLALDEGYYRLMAGSRANDGSVSVDAQYFTISVSKPHTATVTLPDVGEKLFVRGIVDMNTVVVTASGEKTTLKDLGKGRGVMLCFADPGGEPTRHILQELPSRRQALEEWGGGVVFMVPGDGRSYAFDPGRFPGLPSQTVWAADADRELLDRTVSALRIGFRNNFPLVVYLTGNGGIVYFSEGYRIGIVDDVLKTIKQERATK